MAMFLMGRSYMPRVEAVDPIKERILADWRENGFPGTTDKPAHERRYYRRGCKACLREAELASADNMSTTSTIFVTPPSPSLEHDHRSPVTSRSGSTASAILASSSSPSSLPRVDEGDVVRDETIHESPEISGDGCGGNHQKKPSLGKRIKNKFSRRNSAEPTEAAAADDDDGANNPNGGGKTVEEEEEEEEEEEGKEATNASKQRKRYLPGAAPGDSAGSGNAMGLAAASLGSAFAGLSI